MDPNICVVHPTRWLETDSDKLKALGKAGLKNYIQNADFIKQILGKFGDLIFEFWNRFSPGPPCSMVQGYKISLSQVDIAWATGLPHEGLKIGVKRMGQECRHATPTNERKGEDWWGGGEGFANGLDVENVKNETLRYLTILVMEHLSGIVGMCNTPDIYLDAIEEGVKGNKSNWSEHVVKKMRKFASKCRKKTQKYYPYGVVIALLIWKQAPDLWRQYGVQGLENIESLNKRKLGGINLKDLGSSDGGKRQKTDLVVVDMEKEEENEEEEKQKLSVPVVDFEEVENIDGSQNEQDEEKRVKMPLSVVNLEEDDSDLELLYKVEGVSGECIQEPFRVHVEEETNVFDYRTTQAILRGIKARLADQCAETVHQYLENPEEWSEAYVCKVSDQEFFEQHYRDGKCRARGNFQKGSLEKSRVLPEGQLSRKERLARRNKRKEILNKDIKVLVVSIEYVLAHCVHKSRVTFAEGGLHVDPYVVFVHPKASQFLLACMRLFKVVLWSEKPKEVHDLVVQHILSDRIILSDHMSSHKIVSYSIEDCTMTRVMNQGKELHGCYKDLTKVWEDLEAFEENTLLVDVSHVAMFRHKQGNVICPIPYQHHVQVSHDELVIHLLPYLRQSGCVRNFRQFVKDCPFGLWKMHSFEQSIIAENEFTPLFANVRSLPFGSGNSGKLLPSTSVGTCNSELDSFTTQCLGVSDTLKLSPITLTGNLTSQSGLLSATSENSEISHRNSLRASTFALCDHKLRDDQMKDLRQLFQAKASIETMACEKNKLEMQLKEKDENLQKVQDAWQKLNEEKIIVEQEQEAVIKALVEKDKALKQMKLEQNKHMKRKDDIIFSLKGTVQALEEKLGRFEQKQNEFPTVIRRAVEKETAQIHSSLVEVLGLKEGEDLLEGAQQLIEELRQRREIKHESKSEQFMLVINSAVHEAVRGPDIQGSERAATFHMNGNRSTGIRGHYLLTSDTEALNCPICMDEWTTVGDHRICSLACGHLYGMSCIKSWLQRCEKTDQKCPQCNSKAELGDIRMLYVPVIAVTGRQFL
eukprot:Gb_12190 [translate_table: standard]